MEETNKAKLGVVLTDSYKWKRKLQFDVFTEFMNKNDLNISDVYNIYTDNHLRDLEKDLKKLDVVWIICSDILPTHIYPKWDFLLDLGDNYRKNRFVIWDNSMNGYLKPIKI